MPGVYLACALGRYRCCAGVRRHGAGEDRPPGDHLRTRLAEAGPCDPELPSGFEPNIAADPRDPRHLVASWWNWVRNEVGMSPTYPAVVAVSRDGGASWRRVTTGASGVCGDHESYADLWPSIGPDGTTYLAFERLSVALLGADQLVARSQDGGLTWSTAEVHPTGYIFQFGGEPDQPRITADPSRPDVAYDLWEVDGSGKVANGQIMLSTTLDGGASWSSPQTVYDAASDTSGSGGGSGGKTPNSLQLHVLPDHSMVLTFEVLHNINFANNSQSSASAEELEPNELMSMRSTDGGRSWSPAATIAQASTSFPHDPDTGNRVRGFVWLSTAIAPDGTIYGAWQQIYAINRAEILLSSSHDDGATWSNPRPIVRVSGQAWSPTLAVMPDGTIGMTWYDSRNDRTGDGQFTTDVWFASSRDHGQHFVSQHLAGPFDYETAYNNQTIGIPGLFLGDYFGLAALPGGFAAAFGESQPQARFSNQDIFYTRIHIGSGSPAIPAVTLPTSRGCWKPRSLTIRLTSPPSDPVRDISVRINHKLVLKRHGARLHGPIVFRQLPKGRFTISVSAQTRTGAQLHNRRTYTKCR